MVVSSSATGVVHVSPNSVATSRVIVVPDSEVARDGDAISSTGDRQSYNDEGGRVNGGRPGAADEWNRSGPPSLSMSVDLNPNLQDSGHFSASPERVHGPCEPKPELKNDEEESYEAFGSVEGDADDGVDSPPGGSSSAPSPTGTNSLKNPTSPNSTIGRHSWLRTSLRRTPPCSGRKRLSSNALASQLYRSGSFNSSGRGSNCDPADDMYSDVSLEDDVIIGLNHKIKPYDLVERGVEHRGIYMCARNSPCHSPPRARSPTTETPTDDRFRRQHPPHPPYLPYYPPPPPYLNPYGPYPYHPVGGYYNPYCNDVEESKSGSSTSWFGIVSFILLLLCIVGFIIYRSLSRDTQRRLRARLPTLMQPAVQVQMIQEQMDALVDTQSVGEERYARVKQENAMLQARILMLEEAAKDAETRAEERLQAEQRRYRDWASRLERERQLQLENYTIKLQAIESEGTNLREEIGRLREQLEKVKAEKSRLENDLEDTRRELDSARESERQAISRANEAQYELEAAREELSIRVGDQRRIEELMQQVVELRNRNKSLEESRDELQAAAALQAGRELLMLNPCLNNSAEKGPSLAVELLAGINQDQMMMEDGQFLGENGEPCSISEIKQALKEQQEVNTQLRTYIDGILLNIVENYPQLLEVKQTH